MYNHLIKDSTTNYRRIRGFQIMTVFTVTVFIQEFFHIPHSGWMGFETMMIYVGFDNGMTIFRTYHRFLGMLLGLFTGYFLWFLGHLDDRALTLIIPACIFYGYYFSGKHYSVPTIFTINTSLIGLGYFYGNAVYFNPTDFIIEYFVCTVFIFWIIVFFECFIFKPKRMMKYFIYDNEIAILKTLHKINEVLEQKHIRRSKWFQHCIGLTTEMTKLNSLINNKNFIKSSKSQTIEEFKLFVKICNRVYLTQKALYYAHFDNRFHTKQYTQLQDQLSFDMNQLKNIHIKYNFDISKNGE